MSQPQVQNSFSSSSNVNSSSFVPQTPHGLHRMDTPSPKALHHAYISPPQSPMPGYYQHTTMKQETTSDAQSVISELELGSIVPNPHYNPAMDPANTPFVPPTEITVRIKVEVPEWLRMDKNVPVIRPSLGRGRSEPSEDGPKSSVITPVSCHARLSSPPEIAYVNGKPVVLSPRHNRKTSGAASTISFGSLGTSPTASSSDDDSGRLQKLPRLKSEKKHLAGRLSLFHHKRKGVDLKRAKGCLT